MTTATLDYLLRIAIAHRETLAHQMIRSGEDNCPAWVEAAAAVKELLTLRQRAA